MNTPTHHKTTGGSSSGDGGGGGHGGTPLPMGGSGMVVSSPTSWLASINQANQQVSNKSDDKDEVNICRNGIP